MEDEHSTSILYESDTDPHNLSNEYYDNDDDDECKDSDIEDMDCSFLARQIFTPEKNGVPLSLGVDRRSPNLSPSNSKIMEGKNIEENSNRISITTINIFGSLERTPCKEDNRKNIDDIGNHDIFTTINLNTCKEDNKNMEYISTQEMSESIDHTICKDNNMDDVGSEDVFDDLDDYQGFFETHSTDANYNVSKKENVVFFGCNDSVFENHTELDLSRKIYSKNGPIGLKSCLKKPLDSICETDSQCTLNKSVRWKESNEEFIISKENHNDNKSTFDFQRLLNALNQLAENIRSKKEEVSEEPIKIERDYSLKRRIVLIPRNIVSTSVLCMLNFKTFKTLYEKTYKSKIIFKYIPRKLSMNQWRRVDLIFIESLKYINLKDYKTKKGLTVDVAKIYPLLYVGVEGEEYPSCLVTEGINIYQFNKENIEVNQPFCDYVKNLIERNRIVRCV
uniref:ERCC4 domain-containing protein n=1 Tax=Parastrongyloides trichosuri TaxID=131310 RepID=A0A0N4Z0F5_PARTI